MALEDFFLKFSHDKSMKVKEKQDEANLDPRGMVGRIHEEDD